MISYLKKSSFRKALLSHPNYSYQRPSTIYNTGECIGIIADAADRDHVNAFVDKLQTKEVHTIYYSNTKAKKGDEGPLDEYCKSDLSWANVPTSEVVADFLNREYDRLFYMSYHMPQPQYYVYRLTKTKFSVGPLIESNLFPFDLNVELSGQDISTLVSEVTSSINRLTLLS